MSNVDLRHGDCLDVLKTLDADSIDSIVTDPPYGFGDGKRAGFMGKQWDYDVPSVDIWAECLRVLKPGGHLLAFAGTRTQHRMCVNIEDAGFEIRDMIAWVYGSGFPKSLDVSKAIDKAAGAEREVVGSKLGLPGYSAKKGGEVEWGEPRPLDGLRGDPSKECAITAPATPEAQQWEGWGTALKPALEPITVARKPFKGTVAANVLEHGTGALNIDGCRVEGEPWKAHSATGLGSVKFFTQGETPVIEKQPHEAGRWPANLIHDGSDEVVSLFPEAGGGFGVRGSGGSKYADGKGFANTLAETGQTIGYGDSGSAARFFYTAKASKDDRDKGNTHPTVKPTDLMAYLCRLVTPPGGIVLDPFMGSGTTGKAALSEGFQFVGIERDADYFAICESRFNGAQIGLALAL